MNSQGRSICIHASPWAELRHRSQHHPADRPSGRPAPGRHVLEIGPGLGSLTLGLLEAGYQVTAVELDPRLAECSHHGRRQTARGRESVDRHYGRRLTLPDVGAPDALVANLPYNVAVPVLLTVWPICRRYVGRW